MPAETAILITLIAYKVILLGIGFVTQRRTHADVDFYLGGRRLGPWVSAISASASSSSAWTLLGVSGYAYTQGLAAIWIFPACVGGFALNWLVVAPRLRKHTQSSGAVTLTDVVAGPPGREGRWPVAILASTIIVLCLVSYVASQFHAAGLSLEKTFGESFGIDDQQAILIGGAIILLYTLLGGFWAVSITDTLQGLVMAFASVVVPIAALVHVGGLEALREGIAAVPQKGFQDWTGSAAILGGVGFVIAFLGIGLGYPGQPHVVNRFMALREGKGEVRRAQVIALSWAVVVYSGMLLLGWCGRVIVTELGNEESVFVVLTQQLLHPVVAGVTIAAVLSAIMSTADSQLLVAGSSLTHDLRRHPEASTSATRSRVMVAIVCVGALAFALYAPAKIYDRVLFAWTAMGAAFGPLLVVTIFRGPVSAGRAFSAMLAGFALSVACYYWPDGKGVLERTVPYISSFFILLVGAKKPSSG